MIPRRKAHIQKGEFLKIAGMFFGEANDYLIEWEDTFARYIGVKHCVAVSSGRAAMELILKSMEFDRGDEVIIPAYTLKDLVFIIQNLGLKVVLADIEPDTFNINPNSVVKNITSRTKAIVATHMFGSPCKIDEILEIARNKKIFVIEDCAHSLGSEFFGKKTGSFGYASFFSFETIKLVNTYGGGMVATNDGNLAIKIRKIISGYKYKKIELLKKIIAVYMEKWLLPTPLSLPAMYLLSLPQFKERIEEIYRFIQKPPSMSIGYTGIQAYLGLEKIKTLNERCKKRRERANLLKSLLSEKIKPQIIEEKAISNYYFFVALLNGKVKEVRRKLLLKGIDAGMENEIADNCPMLSGRDDCHNTNYVYQNAIQLPLYENLSEQKIRYIAKVLNNQI